MDKKDMHKKIIVLGCYPIFVLILQLTPVWAAGTMALLLFFATFAASSYRPFFFLTSFTAAGHCLWLLYMGVLNTFTTDVFTKTIAGRLGLAGYLLFFMLWQKLQPTQHHYLHLGQYKSIIKMPLVWKGRREPIWRFLLIFSSIFIVAATILFLVKGTARLIPAGVAFALINAVLEEIIWRGYILPRLADMAGETGAVLSSSISFGVYHLSLGFPLWVCLAFAIGGFYFGGATVKSRGISAPILMHIVVNIFFVSGGLIF